MVAIVDGAELAAFVLAWMSASAFVGALFLAELLVSQPAPIVRQFRAAGAFACVSARQLRVY